MTEEIRICAFIDSLGTREIILSEDSGKRIQLIDLIRSLSDRVSTYSDNAENMGGAVLFRPSAQSTTFSDNIAISFPIKTFTRAGTMGNKPYTFNTSASHFFNDLIAQIVISVWDGLKLGILFRGGICVGKLVHDEKIIVGEALVKAVELEKKTSLPRIEISQEIIDLVDDDGVPIVEEYIKDCCIEEIDGRWFIKTLAFHHGYWADQNHSLQQEGKEPVLTPKFLKDISKTLAKEYQNIIKENDAGCVKKWNWFVDTLDATFKTGLWKEMPDSYDAMLGEINKLRKR